MKQILLLILLFQLQLFAQKAVCVVPVADLVGASLSGLNKQNTIEQEYHDLLINGDAELVKRIDQLLFNEVVNIIEERNQEVCITLPHHFYCTSFSKTPQSTAWTLRENIMPLSEIADKNIIPSPLSYQTPTIHPNIITLSQPFYDKKNHRYYSAGTRFVLTPDQKQSAYYQVFVLSFSLKKTTISIPSNLCIKSKERTQEQKIKKFIKILRSFAHPHKDYIPYVLGGNSYSIGYKKGFKEKKFYTNGKTQNFFDVNHPHKGAHSGFDCAALIYRAAQIAELPFYAKNSSAMKHYLQPLAPDEEIENGDIIFIPGHVIAIVEITNNRVVEARTQSHGYGFVHEIDLSLLFKEIKNIEDLKHFHFSKQAASRLDRDGTIIAHKQITILKLRSIFK